MIRNTSWRWICIVCVMVLLLSMLSGCKKDTVSDATTTAPSAESTAATTETTQPATETTGAVATKGEAYWVFAYGGLRVRTGPSVANEMVGSLEDGEVIEVLQWKDDWAYIEKPVKGWCSGAYLHKLGWYKNVKTPEGTPPQSTALVGKWVHATEPVEKDGVWTCRAGIYRLRSNGTFIHSVGDYQKNAEGKWEAINTLVDEPYWVGEYSFNGKQLVLNYMAEMQVQYDKTSGEPKTREWVEWVHTLTLDVTKEADLLTSANEVQIPLTVKKDSFSAVKTFHKATNAVGTPADVCAVLQQKFA